MQIDSLNLTVVSLDAVLWDDATFLLRYGREPDAALEESLGRTGMHNPPLLKEVSGGYAVVYGFERLRLWKKAGRSDVKARVAPPEVSDRDLLTLAIQDNRGGRRLNVIEQALAAEKLGACVSPERLVREFLPLLGQKPSPAALDNLLAYRKLPPVLQEALAKETLDGKTAGLLKSFTEDEAKVAVGCMETFRMSVGARRDFARLALEICRRDDITLGKLTEELGFDPDSEKKAAGEEKPDIPRERARFLEALRRRRYPVLTDLEKAYAERHAELGLTDAVKIRPPKDFEGNRYRLEARLEGIDDLRKISELLAECLEKRSETLQKMFHIRISEP